MGLTKMGNIIFKQTDFTPGFAARMYKFCGAVTTGNGRFFNGNPDVCNEKFLKLRLGVGSQIMLKVP